MKVSDHMTSMGSRLKKQGRHRVTYRAARRNIAKISYRLRKKSRQ
jgi:hypothetical protein